MVFEWILCRTNTVQKLNSEYFARRILYNYFTANALHMNTSPNHFSANTWLMNANIFWANIRKMNRILRWLSNPALSTMLERHATVMLCIGRVSLHGLVDLNKEVELRLLIEMVILWHLYTALLGKWWQTTKSMEFVYGSALPRIKMADLKGFIPTVGVALSTKVWLSSGVGM